MFTSLGFGGAGLLIVYILAPYTEKVMEYLTPLLAECLALVFVFLFAADITLTVTVLYHFDKMVIRMEENFNQNMDLLVDGAASRTNRIKQEIVDTKYHVEEQISSLSKLTRTTVRRAYYFRDSNKKRETLKNQILSLINKAIGRSD